MSQANRRAAASYFSSALLHAVVLAALSWLGSSLPQMFLAEQGDQSLESLAVVAMAPGGEATPPATFVSQSSERFDQALTQPEAQLPPTSERQETSTGDVDALLATTGEMPPPASAWQGEHRRDKRWAIPSAVPRKALPGRQAAALDFVAAVVGHGDAPSVAALPAEAVTGVAVDQLPDPFENNPVPEYPPASLAAGDEGRVVIRVLVSAVGGVDQAEVRRSSGFVELDESALATVRRWRFRPARRAGKEVDFSIDVPIRFVIRSASIDAFRTGALQTR